VPITSLSDLEAVAAPTDTALGLVIDFAVGDERITVRNFTSAQLGDDDFVV
jgi:hypothetical protein